MQRCFQDMWYCEAPMAGNVPLHIRKLGLVKAEKGFQYFLASEFHYFHFIFRGEGVFDVDGRKFAGTPGTLLFFYPGSKCSYRVGWRGEWEYAWAEFGGDWGATLALLGVTRENPCLQIDNVEECELGIRHIFHQLRQNETPGFRPYAAAYDFLELVRDQSGHHSPPPPLIIDRARYIIENPLRQLPRVSELANLLEIDRTTLFRLFRERLGITPKEYIDRIRYDRARDMLLHADLSITEIARFCGFSSQKYFSDWFRRQSGQPPTQYRRR